VDRYLGEISYNELCLEEMPVMPGEGFMSLSTVVNGNPRNVTTDEVVNPIASPLKEIPTLSAAHVKHSQSEISVIRMLIPQFQHKLIYKQFSLLFTILLLVNSFLGLPQTT
jgi:hypothetical protein